MSQSLANSVDLFFEKLNNPSTEQKIKSYAHQLMADYLIEIEQHMKRQKISKKQLAQMLEVSPSHISQIFMHNKFANFKMLAKIAHHLGFTYQF